MPDPTPPRRLRRPFPLDAGFLEAAAGLSTAELGGLALLVATWWPTGVLPTRPADLGRVLHISPQAAKAMTERLAPRFAPGTYLATLRAAHVAKADRRARAGRAGMASRWGIPTQHGA